ncbi:MAG: insulinase family protein, partial [Bdellovibrionota bacterium]
MKIIFAILLILFATHNAHAENIDPSANIKSVKLSNGLKVYLAPSEKATTTQLKFVIDAGTYMEEKGKAGAAHLLEHFLFKDAKLDKSMTYLEAIKENGGDGNAYVNSTETSFYATIPPTQIDWMIETFGNVLLDKTFDAKSVEETKGPVFLERGKPGPQDYARYYLEKLWPKIAKKADFWESEFGISYDSASEAD